MSILQEIEKKESCIPNILGKIKNEDLPLILLGAGDRARSIYLYLKNYDIKIQNIAVNQKYYHMGDKLRIDNKHYLNIEIFEKILNQYKEINLILGFSKYLIPNELYHNTKIKNIFAINIGLTEGYNFDYNYFYNNIDIFENLYNNLQDELSKKLLVAHLNGRIQGIDVDFEPAEWTDPEYFLPDLMDWQSNECLMDCGAFTGDTAAEFIEKMPVDKVDCYKIYCWEPDKDNFKQLSENFKDNKNVVTLNYAVFSEPAVLSFSSGEGESASVSKDGDSRVDAETIDRIAGDQKITFIKMDIEGSELDALKGAKKVITRDHPRLAICLYHRVEDLITIPQYVKELVPEYQLYLRTHSAMPTELVLYCI